MSAERGPGVLLLSMLAACGLAACGSGSSGARPDARVGGGGDGGAAEDGGPPCVPSGPEVCDGVDNDCAAGIDDGFVLSCEPCAAPSDPGCVAATLTGAGWYVGTARNLLVGNDRGIGLPPLPVPSPYLYVANSDVDTVSKVRISDGVEVARFQVGDNPSRTAVDGNGDAWVAMRGDVFDTDMGPAEGVVKIDGDCTPTLAPPAATRECILLDIPAVGHLLRGVAIDARGDAWIGSFLTGEVVQLDGRTGQQKQRIQLSPLTTPYGLAIDQDGYLWVSAFDSPVRVMRVDPVLGVSDLFLTEVEVGNHYTYGVAVDADGGVWYGTFGPDVFRVDSRTGVYGPAWAVAGTTRGVAIDDAGYLWTADSANDRLVRVDRATGAIVTEVTVGSGPVGVATDHEGNVWSANQYSRSVTKVAPDGTVLGTTDVGDGPYTYSDMTGAAFRIFRRMRGTYLGSYGVGAQGATWSSVTWSGNLPPPSTLAVRARAADGTTSGALWQDVVFTGMTAPLSLTGANLEIEVTLATDDRDAVPNVLAMTFQVQE